VRSVDINRGLGPFLPVSTTLLDFLFFKIFVFKKNAKRSEKERDEYFGMKNVGV